MDAKPLVSIVMGSDSDLDIMSHSRDILKEFGIPCEMLISSAHRTPDKVTEYARGAESRGLKVIIAGAGYAAHLAGAIAANTVLPVIGVPLDASSLKGIDSLLSTVQMPAGVPVATVTIGKAGAKNAAILAVQMMAMFDEGLKEKLYNYRRQLAEKIEEKNINL